MTMSTRRRTYNLLGGLEGMELIGRVDSAISHSNPITVNAGNYNGGYLIVFSNLINVSGTGSLDEMTSSVNTVYLPFNVSIEVINNTYFSSFISVKHSSTTGAIIFSVTNSVYSANIEAIIFGFDEMPLIS